jgi:hypothetical protein
MESLFILLSSTFFGYGFSDFVIQKKAKRWHHVGIKKGYHFHHSMYGVVALALTPMTFGNIIETIALAGFGLGIIIEHTIHDSFVFINKVGKDIERDILEISGDFE